MKTVQIPTFDEFNKYEFVGYVEVKIKNKPDYKDLMKITRHLPGIPQGAVGPNTLYDLMQTGKKEIRSFYDLRQKTSMLKNYFVTIKQ